MYPLVSYLNSQSLLHMTLIFSCWEWHYLLRKELQSAAKPLSTSHVSLQPHSYFDVCREHTSRVVPSPIISGACGKIMCFVYVNPICNFEKLLPWSILKSWICIKHLPIQTTLFVSTFVHCVISSVFADLSLMNAYYLYHSRILFRPQKLVYDIPSYLAILCFRSTFYTSIIALIIAILNP